MFRDDQVLKALMGRVGWKQYAFELPLDANNLKSESKRHFQDFHKAVTLQNIFDTMDLVNADALQFNEWLSDFQRSAILRVLSGVFTSDDIIEQTILYNQKGREYLKTRSVSSGFAGYIIKPAQDSSKCVRLKSVSLLFDADETIDLYLYHSTGELIKKFSVEVEAEKEKVHALDELLPYLSDTHKGGEFYLGYIPSETPNPLEYDNPEWYKTYVFGCSSFESSTDFSTISRTSRTYGLNLELCSYNDYTEPIVHSPYLFDQAIGMQVAADVIEQTLNSTRSNKTERLTKEQQTALYNDLNANYSGPEFPYTTGLKNQLRKEVAKIHANFLPKGKPIIQTPCFTCENNYPESMYRFRGFKN